MKTPYGVSHLNTK